MIENSKPTSDPLSDLLRLAEVQAVVSGELRAGGAWALRFPPPSGLKFMAIVRGRGWLRLDGQADALCLNEGDVLLMNWASPYELMSEAGAPTQDATALFSALDPANRVLVLGDASEGASFQQIGGHVRMDSEQGASLVSLLPATFIAPADTPEAPMLHWLMARLVEERAPRRPGHAAVAMRLAQMLFLQTLRMHLARADALPCGWLRAMADPRLLPAMQHMHAEPGRDWQLDELARSCAMSRTSFAVRFKSVAGLAPLAYLTQWRMMLAQHALRHDDRPLGAWVGDLGYASDSAFSHAFRRIVGMSPAQYRRLPRVAAEEHPVAA